MSTKLFRFVVILGVMFLMACNATYGVRPLSSALSRSEIRGMKVELIMQSCEYLVSSVERRNPRWAATVEELEIQRDQLDLATDNLNRLDLITSERLREQVADLRRRIRINQQEIYERMLVVMNRAELRSA